MNSEKIANLNNDTCSKLIDTGFAWRVQHVGCGERAEQYSIWHGGYRTFFDALVAAKRFMAKTPTPLWVEFGEKK